MKHLTTLITILFISLLSSPSFSDTLTVDELVRRDGLFYKKFSNEPFTGDIKGKSIGSIKNGKRIDNWEDYHNNGQLHISKTFVDGKEHGLWVGYHENGRLWGRGKINMGSEVGLWEFFYENGNLEKRGHYKQGRETGIWEWFSKDGKLEDTQLFVH